MKLRFLLPLAALALLFVACEIDDDADADEGVVTPPTCEPVCEEGFKCVSGTCVEDTPDINYLDYRFVRIDDLSPVSETPDGGADIDAVVLDKTDGSQYFADDVIYYEHGGGTSEQLDSTEALGAPDAFEDYPNVDACHVDGGFVSLGGIGGHIVLRMEGIMEQGDGLTVLEVGGCEFWDDPDSSAIIEEIEVAVSVAQDPDNPHWQSLGRGEGPDVFFTIPDLPQIEAE